MDQTERFKALQEAAEELLTQLSKDEIAQCARLLALELVDYRRQFGALEHAGRVGLVARMEIEDASLLCEATEVLLDHLSKIRDGNPSPAEPH
jgi:hypothetical protein